ncbi:MAG: 5'-3' exonuclease [Actinomycetota bacterium]|nr:5'-3' exonuclease [Actinomycetota bacterium]
MTDELTLLVDAPSLIYRAFFSTPDTVRAPDGTPVNAAHGFLRMMARLIQDHDPDRMCCAADENWRPEWRVELIETYKTHRTEAGSLQQQTDAEVSRQVAIIYGLLALCGIQVIGHPDYEAEDVIGTLTARAPGPVAIVSGDRDLFQLVRDPDVWVLYPKRGVSVVDRVDEGFIQKKFGIPGGAYLDYAVLRGDSSDGLPGVRGIGEKIAASLVTKYGSLEAILEAAADMQRQGVVMQKVRADLDYLRRAVQVVTIATDLPLPDEDLTRPRGNPHESVHPLAKGFGLTNAVNGLTDALKSTKGSR